MTDQFLTIAIPMDAYQRLQYRAHITQRPVEVEAAETLVSALPVYDDLPPEMEQTLTTLNQLDDKALWRAARSALPAADAEQLAELNYKRQSEGLSSVEDAQAKRLLADYERYMLIRAEAAFLLKQRGYDMSSPAVLQPQP